MANTAGGGAIATTCRTSDGPQLFYSVTVPAASRGTLTLTRGGAQDVAMRVLGSCTATTCDSSTATTSAMPTTLTVDTAATPRTVIVSVSSTSQATSAPFTLAFATATLPYTLTRLTGQTCDMGITTPLMGVDGDDTNSAIAALPFNMRLFSMSANATAFSVSSNGFVQLFASMMGTPFGGGTSAGNLALPANGAAAPNGMIAALWDDLFPVAGMSTVTTGVVGAAPNRRFVIQWNNWTHFDMPSRSVRLTFQTRLYETTGVIENVYCTMNPGMDTANIATGASATIGIESLDGANATQASFNTAMTVADGVMFRFTPN
jgi:hypothetical protein